MRSVLLCRIKNKDNVGAIFRICYQFGIDKIYSYESSIPGKTNTYKTERQIPIEHVTSLDFLKNIKEMKIALETGGFSDFYLRDESIKPKNYLLAVGNESFGFNDQELNLFDLKVTLNSCVRESYNVSHALAIGLYLLEF